MPPGPRLHVIPGHGEEHVHLLGPVVAGVNDRSNRRTGYDRAVLFGVAEVRVAVRGDDGVSVLVTEAARNIACVCPREREAGLLSGYSRAQKKQARLKYVAARGRTFAMGYVCFGVTVLLRGTGLGLLGFRCSHSHCGR